VIRAGKIHICGDEVNVFIDDGPIGHRVLSCSYADLLESRITGNSLQIKFNLSIERARSFWERRYNYRVEELKRQGARLENQLFCDQRKQVDQRVREICRDKVEEAARELLHSRMGWGD
jgi:hypothetical protein